MNKALLKNYAPQARQDFIAAVIARLRQVGKKDKLKIKWVTSVNGYLG
jgi:hypothetical protein